MIINKLQIDRDLFTSKQEMWYTIYICLGNAAQQTVSTFYAAGATMEYDPDQFLDYLERNYGNQNLSREAANALRNLRQTDTQKFAAFLPKFERLIADAQGSTWADNAKIAFLKGALNTRLSNNLVLVSLPQDYTSWVTRVGEVASRLERVASTTRATPSAAPRYTAARPPQLSRDTEGDTPMGGVNKVKSTAQQRGNKVNRTCFVCDSKEHIKKDCPHRASVKVTRLQVEEESFALSGENTTESENEDP